MPDKPLWDLVNPKPRKHNVINLAGSYESGLDAARELGKLYKTNGDANNPAAPARPTALRDPNSGNILMIKRQGIYYTTAGILLNYGVAKAKANAAGAISQLIPLTDQEYTLLLKKVHAKALDGLGEVPENLQKGTGANPRKDSAARAFKNAQKEGREPAGGKYGFGVSMRTAKGGGLVEAARPGNNGPYYRKPAAMPREVLSPIEDKTPWKSVDQDIHRQMMAEVARMDV